MSAMVRNTGLTNGPRVLFQSRNRRGLGHLMRGLNLAREVLDLAPGAQVSMHTRNESAPDYCPAQVECVVEDAAVPATGWAEVLERLAPDIVVYDTMLPTGAEPLPAAARVCYVMRRCRPERQAQVFASAFLRERVDAVVVPHTAAEFGYPLPAGLSQRARFAGLIARRPDPAVQARLRATYDLADASFVLVSTGGAGGFAHSAQPFFAAVAAVQRALAERVGLRHVVVLGPHFRGAVPDLSGAVVVRSEPALVDLFAVADLVVAEGGYNSVSELRLVKTPAVFLPGERALDDQEERVRALARLGLAVVLAGASPTAVAREVAALVQTPERMAQMRTRYRHDTVEVGNRTAAAHLLGLVAS